MDFFYIFSKKVLTVAIGYGIIVKSKKALSIKSTMKIALQKKSVVKGIDRENKM